MLKYNIKDGIYGKFLYLEQMWNDDFIEIIKKNNIKQLCLNYTYGWKHEGELTFLKKLSDISIIGLSLTDMKINNLRDIYNLSSLQLLFLDTDNYTEIDLSYFSELKRLELHGNAHVKSLAQGRSLQQLVISKIRERDLKDISNLYNLQSLEVIRGSITSLNNIYTLKNLKKVELYYLPKLSSLEGLEKLDNIEELILQSCKKVRFLYPISRLPKLHTIIFRDCGDIETLRVLKNLENLIKISFVGSTNIADGDIKVLKEIKTLKFVGFTPNRRHYNLKNDAFTKESIKK